MNALLFHIVGVILTSFAIKIFNKYVSQEHKVNGYVGLFIALTGWFGFVLFLFYALAHYLVYSKEVNHFVEKYKKWVEGE